MGDPGRIRMPLKQRLRRFRFNTLPMLGLALALFGTAWFWRQAGEMPHALGTVEAQRIDAAANLAGQLMPLPQGPWSLFDTVEANQVVAQFDDKPLRAQLVTATAELARIRKELTAMTDKLTVGETDRTRNYFDDTARLQVEVEQRRLTVAERRAQVTLDRLEAQRTNLYLECIRPLYEKKLVSEQEMVNARLYAEEAAKKLAEDVNVLGDAEKNAQDCEARLKRLPGFQATDIAKELEPISAAADVQVARIEEINLQISRLAVRAPIGGVIVAIQHLPIENIRAGDPIVTIAAPRGRYLVGYVRQEQHIDPKVGMKVDVRTQAAISRPVPTFIERVGPHVEPVPLQLCRDPKMPEWGVPVRIAMPKDFAGRPGQIFNLTFHTNEPVAASTP